MCDSEFSTNHSSGNGLENMTQQNSEDVLNIKIDNVKGHVDLDKYLTDESSDESNAPTKDNYNNADLNNELPGTNNECMTEAPRQYLQCAECQGPARFIAYRMHNDHNLMMSPVHQQCALCDQHASFISVNELYRMHNNHNLMMRPVHPQCALCDQPASFISVNELYRVRGKNHP